jgi:hypothetical protein
VTPVLGVHEVAASIDYYVHVPGFKINFRPPGFASVSRRRCGHVKGIRDIAEAGPGLTARTLKPMHEEYKASGAKIPNPPTNDLWALEMQVEDPDGNILRLGSDQKKDEPIRDW